MTTRERTARSFSGHRFSEAYPSLAEDVRWDIVGGPIVVGKQAVIDICQDTLDQLVGTSTEFTKFRTVVGDVSVVVDSTGEYHGPDGSTSVVASCDIFDFADDLVVSITSYTTELSSEHQADAPASME
jgi:SnoaL-like domain